MDDPRQAFEKVIKDNPYDMDTRRMYADWLEENGFDDEAAEQRRRATLEWVEADRWMHWFADECGGTYDDFDYEEGYTNYSHITYEQCIEAGHTYLKSEDYFVQYGTEEARTLMHAEKKNFWKNWSIITGVKINDDLRSGGHGSAPFSCSC